MQRTNPSISSNFQRYQQQLQLNGRQRLIRKQVERFEISNNKGADNLSMSISESEPNKRSAEQLLSDSKRQKTESSVKVVIPNVVIDVDNSDDDELEVLTMKLRKERSADDGVSTKKRIYYAMEPVKQQKIIIRYSFLTSIIETSFLMIYHFSISVLKMSFICNLMLRCIFRTLKCGCSL